MFVANVGTAIPIANTIELLGAAVAAHGVPLQTVASGNTVDFNIQYASAVASSVAGNAGVASFNSAFFTVDANGFVSISGGSILESFTVDASTPPGTNPVVPNGSGIVTVTGGQVAAGTTTNVIRTNSLALNTYTIEIQRSQAVATSTIGDNGVSHFDSAAFDVDANGFVQLNGGGIAATSFTIQSNTAPGTNPVVPTASGVVTVNGAAVANHSVVLETRSRALNAYNVEVQYATSAAATDATKSGVAHFDSSQFSVDASGFVSLAGAGEAIDSIGTQTGTNPIVPTVAGLVTINGAVVAAGTNPIRSNGTGANTMAMEVQISQALAATDATKIGLSNFSSAHFSVDANGFVTLAGGGQAVDSFSPDSGTDPVVPNAAGLINDKGSGSITTVGSLNTITTQLTGLTNHAVLVGAGTTTITKVGPTATAGQVLQSAGSSADPAFSTATYPSTTTVSQILYSSATNVVSGLATANQGVLTTGTGGIPVITPIATNGQLIIGSTAGAPAAATITAGTGMTVTNGSNSITLATTAALSGFNSVVIQQFTANGTYTPTTGMKYCIIECVGSGGGGGGVAVSTGGILVGGGGGAGGYAQIVASSATVGVSQTVTVGAAGTGGANTGGTGGTGNTTSVGAICAAAGGVGGGSSSISPLGGAGGAGTTGTVLVTGNAGGVGFTVSVSGWVLCFAGQGAAGPLGGAPAAVIGSAGAGTAGNSGVGYGSGGGGAVGVNNATGRTGGAGAAGFVRITEFIST